MKTKTYLIVLTLFLSAFGQQNVQAQDEPVHCSIPYNGCMSNASTQYWAGIKNPYNIIFYYANMDTCADMYYECVEG
jgi:hypothetical protein